MQYNDLRATLFSKLSCAFSDLPTRIQYAAVIPQDCALSNEEIFYIQSFMVQVWMHHIKPWHAGGHLTVIPRNIDSQQVMRGEDIEENCHLLSARATGPGMWRKRCGKYTSLLKHVRLKITKSPCANPKGAILAQERRNMVETKHRLEKELNLKYNAGDHSLQ